MSSTTISPMMQQWYACKKQAGKALLLFRLGEFYEAFEEDAKELAQLLNITLTARHGIPMAGVPAHTLDSCIAKLVEQKKRIAVAEQTEQILPKGKKIISRSVMHVISSGTANQFQESCTDSHLLLCLIYEAADGKVGLALTDTSTGEIWGMECLTWSDCEDELELYQPAEIVVNKTAYHRYQQKSFPPTVFPDTFFLVPNAEKSLCQHLGTHNLEGIGLHNKFYAVVAVNAALRYIAEELHQPINHIQTFRYIETKEYLKIDQATQKNLSLLQFTEGEKNFSLFHHMNHTKTPMGLRLLRNWIAKPLLQTDKIEERQDVISALFSDNSKRKQLIESLLPVRDLERISVRLEKHKKTTHDLIALRASYRALPEVYKLCQTIPPLWRYIESLHTPVNALLTLLEAALVANPSLKIGEEVIFNQGWDDELDQWRKLLDHSKKELNNYQEHLRETLQIKTLKIGSTPAFGYFIEVSKGSLGKVPDSLKRRQTLVHAERFSSEELRNSEESIVKTEQKIEQRETQLLFALQEQIRPYLQEIKAHGQAIACIDAFQSLADVAARRNYVRPKVDASRNLYIEKGRHPLVETSMLPGEFVSNSLYLDPEHSLMILTGPNMGGKSTYMRQAALLVIMAQMGSFVPAKAMVLGYVDQLFGRIGAFDALQKGQSTFMVEMIELSYILRTTTSRSLLIIDEIGRGTSTYDGIAIAQAALESLLQESQHTPRTLFSTHYRELTCLASKYPHAFNAHVSVEEKDQSIQFLHRICEGIGAKSLGIHVAQLAGVPNHIIARAKEILMVLEQE